MSASAKRAAEHAVRELAARPAAFTAPAAAALADLPPDAPALGDVLRMRCLRRDIMLVQPGRFLGREPALRWWCRFSARLAMLGINRMPPAQLGAAMALAFDARGWESPPANLLDLGRQNGMAQLGAHGDIVFPWAVLLRTNRDGLEAYRAVFYNLSSPDESRGVTLDSILRHALAQLPDHYADIMRKRHGLDGDGEVVTLAALGMRYRITRERVRQIQNKATKRIMQADIQRRLWRAFVADFMQSGCSPVMFDAQRTPNRRFLHAMLGLNTRAVADLNLRIIGPARAVDAYNEFLRRDLLDASEDDARRVAERLLAFMPVRDTARIVRAQQRLRDARIAKSMPRMVVKALRELGRAAHYGEIAALCNRLFPQSARTTRNWHAALCRFAAHEKFGIVWIGRRGMFGLKEHDYARPAERLYDAIPRIVRAQFAATGRPVAFEAVLQALGKQRRELNPDSVSMVLIFSEQIEEATGGYLPATPTAPAESNHNITAAMRAFTAERDADDAQQKVG